MAGLHVSWARLKGEAFGVREQPGIAGSRLQSTRDGVGDQCEFAEYNSGCVLVRPITSLGCRDLPSEATSGHHGASSLLRQGTERTKLSGFLQRQVQAVPVVGAHRTVHCMRWQASIRALFSAEVGDLRIFGNVLCEVLKKQSRLLAGQEKNSTRRWRSLS